MCSGALRPSWWHLADSCPHTNGAWERIESLFPLTTGMPRNPPLARDNGIVWVEARVDAGGGVADVKVIRSARPFDEPALDAARRWTFRPARVRGTAVATLAYIAFAFRQPVTVLPGKRPE